MCKSLPGVIGVKGQEAIKPTVVRVQEKTKGLLRNQMIHYWNITHLLGSWDSSDAIRDSWHVDQVRDTMKRKCMQDKT